MFGRASWTIREGSETGTQLVLNRSVGKMHLFGMDADFEAFQRVMIEAHQRHPIRILSYCVLSNHRDLGVRPSFKLT